MNKKLISRGFITTLLIVLIQGLLSVSSNVFASYIININNLEVKVNTSDYRYKAKERKAEVKIYDGYRILENGIDYTLDYENHYNVGTAKVIIRGINNYEGTIERYYQIIPQNIKSTDIKINSENYTYSGKARKAWVKVYYNGKRLKENEDYELKYKNYKNTGKAEVTIKGIGNYNGSVKKTYKIVPKKAKIKEVVMNSKSTEATIKWNKDNQADGYVIYRATKIDGEYEKIKNVADTDRTSYTVKKLNSNKTYYFKVRTYVMVDGKKAYSKKYSDPKPTTELLAKVTLTSTSSPKNRNTNLKVASKAISGLVLKPGETFNWFKVVGPATIEKGYKSATVFVDKKPVPGVGGGICQVSTTLYQAAKKAGLKMVERHTHSLPVTYTTPGKDATVAYGVKNLRIKNNKKYSIKFVTTADKNKTTCKIYRVNN